MYVIQHRVRSSDNWETFTERYPTLEAAQAAFDKLSGLLKAGSRIAEEYTVTRYKSVTPRNRGEAR